MSIILNCDMILFEGFTFFISYLTKNCTLYSKNFDDHDFGFLVWDWKFFTKQVILTVKLGDRMVPNTKTANFSYVTGQVQSI